MKVACVAVAAKAAIRRNCNVNILKSVECATIRLLKEMKYVWATKKQRTRPTYTIPARCRGIRMCYVIAGLTMFSLDEYDVQYST